MKLGKALATGVAEERELPQVADETAECPERAREIQATRESQAAASEEVPAAR